MKKSVIFAIMALISLLISIPLALLTPFSLRVLMLCVTIVCMAQSMSSYIDEPKSADDYISEKGLAEDYAEWQVKRNQKKEEGSG